MDESLELFRTRLHERRTSQGITLKELAEMIGVKDATIQRYESGAISNVPHERIVKLADALHCSASYLMGWSDSVLDFAPTVNNIDDTQRLLAYVEALSGKDREVISKYIKLSSDQKSIVESMIDQMLK